MMWNWSGCVFLIASLSGAKGNGAHDLTMWRFEWHRKTLI